MRTVVFRLCEEPTRISKANNLQTWHLRTDTSAVAADLFGCHLPRTQAKRGTEVRLCDTIALKIS